MKNSKKTPTSAADADGRIIIAEFLRRYEHEYDYYQEVARQCAQRLETALEQSGIRAIVTWRAKRPDRLRTKIERRHQKTKYSSVDDIFRDIVDLAGVRVALYFPADLHEVRQIIAEKLVVDGDPKEDFVPNSSEIYVKKFKGYQASHFRACLPANALGETQKRYAEAVIEVQVASVLMHAWSEVEHDLVYKPFSGEPSLDEHAILDQLNGLIMTGEVALESLQRAVRARVNQSNGAFRNHYDLAAFLYNFIRPAYGSGIDEPVLGRVDILHRFLTLTYMNSREKLKPFMDNLALDLNGKPVSEQLVDLILDQDTSLYGAYTQAQMEAARTNPYHSSDEEQARHRQAESQLLVSFIRAYNIFGAALAAVYKRLHPDQVNRPLPFVMHIRELFHEYGLLESSNDFSRVAAYRNRIVHGNERINNLEIVDSLQNLAKLLLLLRGKLPNSEAGEIDRAILEISSEVDVLNNAFSP